MTTSTAVTEALDRGLSELARLRQEADEIDRLKAEVQTAVLRLMEEQGLPSHLTSDGLLKGTRVAPEKHVVDPEALRKRIGNERYHQLTKEILDEEKVKAAITTGDLDPLLVADCSIDRSPRPYVKVTRVKDSER